MKKLSRSPIEQWSRWKQRFLDDRRVWISFGIMAVCIISLRSIGFLQFGEWEALDWFFRLRPPQTMDERILIVGIQEADLQQIGRWPIPDSVMAELIEKLDSLQPRVIGLDIYRDLPVQPGHAEWLRVAATTPNLIGIEQIKGKNNYGVAPPPVLRDRDRVGFNNIAVDADGKVRRSYLYAHVDKKAYTSFAHKLALTYLAAEGIKPQAAANNPRQLQLGKSVFRRFEANDGGYVRADSKGYQILANFKGPAGRYRTVSMAQVLAGKVPAEWVRDRIVLIGSTATSLKDVFFTPYSSGDLTASVHHMYGVELQANFISQIIGAAKGEATIVGVWSEPVEWLWIWIWSGAGAFLVWRSPSVTRSIFYILLASLALIGIAYLAFLTSWWIPLLPPMLGLVASAIVITGYIAYLKEELKRSKEFLQNVIDAIPDPIFVKDKQHRWVVLNHAYAEFLGYPLETLIEKSDPDFFSSQEADTFWLHDRLIFQTGKPAENEENFTDARGITHAIATKRSLHKDAAGNIFLVGVIRDITERKRLEEDLKRVALELVRSNAELKVSEDRLRYLAYHDSLTGLPNRKLFQERLSQSLEWADQNQQLVGLLFLDLDGFKQINDSLGHDMGDLLLQSVAERLKRCLRGSDTVSRLGGDEFTVILPGIPSLSDVSRVADKILATIDRPFPLKGELINVTASIGISVFPSHGDDIDTLIKNADAAMYSAKQLGKNKYAFS